MVLLLELARGLAALWVFFYHVKDYFKGSSEVLFDIAGYGYLGVPMFFVISGFVITYSAESTLKANKSPLLFLKKRFLRIYPTFWVSIFVVILLPYLIELLSVLKTGSFVQPENLLHKYSLNEWINFVLLSKVFFAEGQNLQGEFNAINAVYWTIAIEFQFYLVVFISLILKKYYRATMAFVSTLGVINLAVPFGANYGLFIHYWPSFSVGIALAYIFKAKLDLSHIVSTRFSFPVAILSTLLTISCASLVLDKASVSFLFALAFGIGLWCISPVESVLENISKQNKTLGNFLLKGGVALGAMSYSVYLLHGKLHLLSLMFVRQVVGESSVFYGLLTIVLTLCICYPFYYFIERRFMSSSHVNMHDQAKLIGPASNNVP